MSLVRGTEPVLCPRSYGLHIAPEHVLHDRLLEAAYKAAERDGDSEFAEMTEAAHRQYYAMVYGKDNEYGMRAYVANTQGMVAGHGLVTVRAAWLHCRVCGLILPGQYCTEREEVTDD